MPAPPPPSPNQILIDLCNVLKQRLDRISIPRSLCEAELDEEHWQGALAWAGLVKGAELERWLSTDPPLVAQHLPRGISTQGALGLLLLLVASAVIRRESTKTRGLWQSVIAQFKDDARPILFRTDHPNSTTKRLIRAAVGEFCLRHHLYDPEAHRYYRTVHLQVGWHRRALEQLPDFLTGARLPTALSALHQQVPECASLWRLLQSYHDGATPLNVVTTRMNASPWVAPTSTEQLEIWLTGGHRSTNESLPSSATLHWPANDEPYCLLPLQSWVQTNLLTMPRYRLFAAGEYRDLLIRQSDGTYTMPRVLHVPVQSPYCTLTIMDDASQVVQSETIRLWDTQEDVHLVSERSGEFLDPWNDAVSPNSGYLLLTSSDLVIEPGALVWRRESQGDWQIHRIEPGDVQRLKVCLTEGEEYWAPQISTSAKMEQEPDWASGIGLHLFGTALCDPLQLCLSIAGLPSEVSVDRCRLAGQSLRAPSGPTWGPISLLPEQARKPINVTLFVRERTDLIRLSRKVIPQINGFWLGDGKSGQWIPKGAPVEIPTHQSSQIIVPAGLVPSTVGPVWLFEHDRPLAVVAEGLIRLPSLAIRGGTLSLGTVQFNAIEPRQTLAKSIAFNSPFSDAKEVENWLQIQLRNPVECGEAHGVLTWGDGAPGKYAHGDSLFDLGGGVWEAPLTYQPGRTVISLSYGGVHIGTQWPTKWPATRLTTPTTPDVALELSALLRWALAPLLSPEWRKPARTFAQYHFPQFLVAALSSKGLPEGLDHATIDPGWPQVIRTLYAGWTPTSLQAEALLRLIGGQTLTDQVMRLTEGLSGIDPVLLYRILGATAIGTREVDVAANYALGCTAAADSSTVSRTYSGLLSKTADSLHTADSFVKNVLEIVVRHTVQGQPLTALARQNLILAQRSKYFFQLLTYDFLRSLADNMRRGRPHGTA